MCNCHDQGPAFDKNALQQSVNLMGAAISRVSSLERALKSSVDTIELMKGAIGKDAYRFGASNAVTWHVWANEFQLKMKKILDE